MVLAAIRWFGEAVVLRHGGVVAVFAGYATRESLVAVAIRWFGEVCDDRYWECVR